MVKPVPLNLPRDLGVLTFILIVAAVLRLAHPEYIGYHQDQADLATLAQDLVEGKSLPLLGIPSSARLPNSPMTVYVVAIPFLLSDSPVVATAFIAILNVIGVGLLWYLVRRYVGARVALIAGLAYAVNPWAISYSNSIWAQDYHTPIFLAGLLFGLYGFVEGKTWGQLLCLPVLVIAMQIHFAAWLYVPMYLWLLWLGRSRLSKRVLAASAFLAVLTMLPYAAGIVQALSADTATLSIQAQGRDFSLREIAKPYGYIAWLTTGIGLEQYSARGLEAEMLAAIGIPTLIWVLLGLFTLVGIIAFLQFRQRWFTILIFLWVFVPILVLTIPVVAVAPHYFVPTIPALSLLTAMGVDWLLEKLASRWSVVRPVLLASLAGLFISQGVFAVRASEFLDKTYTPTQFGFGPSIHYLYGVQDTLRTYKDVVLVGSGDWVSVSRSGSAVWSNLLRGTAHCTRDLFVSENFAVLPDRPFAAVFTPLTPDAPVFDRLYRSGNPMSFDLRPGEGSYTIYGLERAPEWGGSLTAITPAVFENGLELHSYALDSGRVTLRWRLPAAQPREYAYAVRFLNEAGDMIEQQTAPFWPGKNWCEGDHLISWLPVSIPKNLATLQVGLFRPGDQTPVLVVDEASGGMNPSVEIPVLAAPS